MKMRRCRGKKRRFAKVDRQCQGAAMKGFRLVVFLILLCLQETQVKARGTSLVHLEEMEVEADRSGRRRMGTNAEISREDPVLLNSNSSSLNEMGCREVECGTRDSKEKETARKRTR